MNLFTINNEQLKGVNTSQLSQLTLDHDSNFFQFISELFSGADLGRSQLVKTFCYSQIMTQGV